MSWRDAQSATNPSHENPSITGPLRNMKTKHSVHFSSASDDWRTPPELFAELHAEFGFTLDAASNGANALCRQFFTAANECLADDCNWSRVAGRGAVWLNPPYSRGLQAAFIRKAYAESLKGATVVCLIPARPDTAVWHDVILPYAEVRFIRGRVRFVGATAGAPFPSALVIFRPPGSNAGPNLINASYTV
jgi:site-specific DNA-methyltransferase (adenine-specific)